MGLEGPFWQRFIFENLDGLCLYYDRLHPSEGVCRGGATMAKGVGIPVSDEVLVKVAGGPCLGPWMVAIHWWLPRLEG